MRRLSIALVAVLILTGVLASAPAEAPPEPPLDVVDPHARVSTGLDGEGNGGGGGCWAAQGRGQENSLENSVCIA